LSIELVFFYARPDKDKRKVKLEWQTASEVNNDFFTIEKSLNGTDWEIVKKVDGAGNSGKLLNYSAYDYSPYAGVSYYRLKQTDYDGGYTISGIISIDNLKGTKSVIRISNMKGQEVDMKFEGLRILQYDNGEILKVSGKYMHSDE
jgi:hypothetical protein